MRYRLRYMHHDIELSEGQFAVGRSSGCQLSLDDPLVSRRHALLTVSLDQCTIEDLGSRNGVIVNGRKIAGTVGLFAGDRVLIGSQELTLLGDSGVGSVQGSVQQVSHTLPKLAAALEGADRRAPHSTPAPKRDTPSRVPAPRFEDETDPSMVRRADAFRLLGRVAEKALALGRNDEAERLLASALTEVIESTRAGKAVAPALVDTAARFAAKLATGTGKAAWIDYIFELYLAQRRPCPGPVVDELYGAFRRARGFDSTRLRAYLSLLRDMSGSYGPAERFLVQRIEGLERLATVL